MSKSNLFLLAVLLLLPAILTAKVLSIEIVQRDTILHGRSWGEYGPYELWKGKVFFATDPENASNRGITDIDYAPTDENGRVRSSADLMVLKPLDQTLSKMALVEVSNRGGKFTPSYFLNGQGRLEDPQDAMAFGDGLLMQNGITVIWVGWQFDLPEDKSLLRFVAPHASYPEGSPITGLVRSDWTVDKTTQNLKLGHRDQIGYKVYDRHSSIHSLTKRAGRDLPRITVPRDQWSFGKLNEDGTTDHVAAWIHSEKGFEKGYIYELVYHSQNPPLVGLGLAAVRDIISYAKYDEDCPFGVEKGLAAGVSQTGRFLRTFLYQGFNKDEMNRKAYDGMMIITAGAGRGSFNHRFAQPSRDAHRYSAFLYPTDIFPFTGRSETDTETGTSDGLLTHLDESLIPSIMYVNTGYEYWGRAASLIHTTPDGTADITPLDNERIYHIASGQHYVDQFPPNEIPSDAEVFVGNPLLFKPNYRALLMALHDWVGDGTEPPPARYPTIEDETLVTVDQVQYPSIPGFTPSKVIHTAYRADYGNQWNRGIITNQPPQLNGTFTSLVPQVDRFGNEVSGIRNVELLVPLATYIPYSLRSGMAGGNGEIRDFRGTFIPFPIKAGEGDPRPAISDLYASKNDYLLRVRMALDTLVQQRLVLAEDVHLLTERASSYWSWIHQKEPTSSDDIGIMTFNIRYDNPGDSLSAWPFRKDFAVDVMKSYEPDFIGLQEALEHQVKDVKRGLRGYRWVGVGREDGNKEGEFAPLFYRRKTWKLIDWNHFWLSPTPDVPSKGWDAAHERIVTWARFRHKKNKKEYLVYNTHFDHRGEEARRESVLQIINHVASQGQDIPFYIMGDFNFNTQSIPYLTITSPSNDPPILDSKLISSSPPLGPEGTFSGFVVEDNLPTDQIDHIFVHENARVLSFEIINKSRDGRYPSDHFPVYIRVEQ